MKITLMTSSADHPVYPRLVEWRAQHGKDHEIELKIGAGGGFAGGDILFLISCSDIIPGDIRAQYRKTLVVHASDLPNGRGWSPMIWQILEGRSDIMVTILEAEDKVDTGAIWFQKILALKGHELSDEIHEGLNAITVELMTQAVNEFETVKPREQATEGVSYYSKRTPEDSRLDPGKTIAEQFDLLRVADPNRYPAFFDYRGERYYVHIRKASDE